MIGSYIFLFFVLLGLQVAYIKLAENLNIVDRPNSRSSHDTPVVRGGGIIIFLSIVVCFLFAPNHAYFYFGVLVVAVVGFLDDLFSVPRRYRVIAHIAAIVFLLFQIQLDLAIWMQILAVIVAVGIINAYNFMDGINGISGIYAIVFFISVYYINIYIISFIQDSFVILPLISFAAFGVHNFRSNARLFMGDIGSTTLAFISLFIVGELVSKTGDWSFLFLMTVYGLDSIFTILIRLVKRENILEAHRSHLYQFLANEIGINHIVISIVYGLCQLVINITVILNYEIWHWSFFQLTILILTPAVAMYWITRHIVMNKIARSQHA